MYRLLALASLLFLAACTPSDLLRLMTPVTPLDIGLQADTSDSAYSPENLESASRVLSQRLKIAGINADVSFDAGGEITVKVSGYTGDNDDLIPLLIRRGELEFADFRNAPPELLFNGAGTVVATSANPDSGGQADPVTGAPYETIISPMQVIEAAASDNGYGWQVDVRFSPEHGALLAEYTAANLHTAIGVIIDGELFFAPVIQAQIGERAVVAGSFSESEARALATILGGGVLPLALELVYMR